MDNLLYVLITNTIIIVSFICFIVMIVVHIVKKQKFTPVNIVLMLIFMTGMYLYIPCRYLISGFTFQNPEMLEKAVKLSINPYEKRLAYKYEADIYSSDYPSTVAKDGNKAIYYYEKAINGEYAKYPSETMMLALLYSIKGDYDKTTELNKLINTEHSLSMRNVYIMKDDFEKALETFNDNNTGTVNYLKAAILDKLGRHEEAKAARDIAEKNYNYNLNKYTGTQSKIIYSEEVEKYKTADNYKDYLIKRKQDLNFEL